MSDPLFAAYSSMPNADLKPMFNQSSHAPLAQPTTLPDYDRPFGLPAFNRIEDVIAAYDGDDAIHVLYPQVIAAAAQTFLSGFPGKVLYAVKANPHPAVIRILWSAGIRHFDVASIREIDLVRAIAPAAELYLMHPVKSRKTIRHAYDRGVRHMALDCASELRKIMDETGAATDLNLHVRISVPSDGSAMPLDGKFGADFETAIALLRAARQVAANLGICFHVGSQCMDIDAYRRTFGYARSLIDAAGVRIDSLDCGGGFPVAYPGMVPAPVGDYFDAIRDGINANGFADMEIIGEPGRALCAEGGSTLTRVELRKGTDLYINDGSYGSLFDAAQCSWKFPVRRVSSEAKDGETTRFRLFGPTCDSLDVMEGPFHLPSDMEEGDWIEVQNLGAYGQTLATDFNGFQSDVTVAVMSRA
ncbi:MAG: type III PLP-dependent enzyme [Pseudomonadota bacterium]